MRTCSRHTGAAMALCAFAVALWQPWTLLAQAPAPARVKYAQVSPADLKEWLTYLSSDTLQGRQVFSEGYGLAASYIAERLRSWGVKPIGDEGTFFENVRLRGYRTTRNSSVTVTANGQTRTFKHGDHVTFAVNSGGKQTLEFDGVELVGYGQASDYQGRDVKNKLVVWMPNLSAAAHRLRRPRARRRRHGDQHLRRQGARSASPPLPRRPPRSRRSSRRRKRCRRRPRPCSRRRRSCRAAAPPAAAARSAAAAEAAPSCPRPTSRRCSGPTPWSRRSSRATRRSSRRCSPGLP